MTLRESTPAAAPDEPLPPTDHTPLTATGRARTHDDFFRRMPKADLHCHLVGTLPAEDMLRIARRNGVQLPTDKPAELYGFADFFSFLDVLMGCAEALRTAEDFAEAVEISSRIGSETGNLRYRELFWDPTDHMKHGVPYATMIAGLVEGASRSEAEHGVTVRLVPCINRMESPAMALDLVREVVAERRDEVVGIGLDAAENAGRPALFAEAYQLAGRHGLKRTAHVCEDNQTLETAPPSNVTDCLDLLGCDRLDHGYLMMADPAVVDRVRRDGIHLTVGSHTAMPTRARLDKRYRGVTAMLAAGLNLSWHGDDPAMFDTNPGETWARPCHDLALGRDIAERMVLDSVDAAWLDDTDKRAMRAEFRAQFEALR